MYYPELYIRFNSVGKKSPAHYAAYGVFSGRKKPDFEARVKDLMKIINDPRAFYHQD
jgi:hypothetical protein